MKIKKFSFWEANLIFSKIYIYIFVRQVTNLLWCYGSQTHLNPPNDKHLVFDENLGFGQSPRFSRLEPQGLSMHLKEQGRTKDVVDAFTAFESSGSQNFPSEVGFNPQPHSCQHVPILAGSNASSLHVKCNISKSSRNLQGRRLIFVRFKIRRNSWFQWSRISWVQTMVSQFSQSERIVNCSHQPSIMTLYITQFHVHFEAW